MDILLPRRMQDLAAVRAMATAAQWALWSRAARRITDCFYIAMPRFHVRQERSLVAPLVAQAMGSLFGPSLDLSRMTSTGRVAIGSDAGRCPTRGEGGATSAVESMRQFAVAALAEMQFPPCTHGVCLVRQPIRLTPPIAPGARR
jgi:hypothetical protein